MYSRECFCCARLRVAEGLSPLSSLSLPLSRDEIPFRRSSLMSHSRAIACGRRRRRRGLLLFLYGLFTSGCNAFRQLARPLAPPSLGTLAVEQVGPPPPPPSLFLSNVCRSTALATWHACLLGLPPSLPLQRPAWRPPKKYAFVPTPLSPPPPPRPPFSLFRS